MLVLQRRRLTFCRWQDLPAEYWDETAILLLKPAITAACRIICSLRKSRLRIIISTFYGLTKFMLITTAQSVSILHSETLEHESSQHFRSFLYWY
uniref:Uncharacterized protein n=1 Tax=Romanomermis culicivorax TaxID=13658 RepID=A0A915KZA1_ROMCU